MKYRYIDSVKKSLYITSHEPAFHYSVLEVPAQHRSTPLLQRNVIILHWRAARSGDDHSCQAFALSYFRARFRVFAFFARKCRASTGPRHAHTHISCTAGYTGNLVILCTRWMQGYQRLPNHATELITSFIVHHFVSGGLRQFLGTGWVSECHQQALHCERPEMNGWGTGWMDCCGVRTDFSLQLEAA